MTVDVCQPGVAFQVGAWAVFVFAVGFMALARAFSGLRSVPARAPLEQILEEEAMQLTFDDAAEAIEAKEAVLSELAETHEGWMALAVEKFHATRHLLPEDFLGEDIRRVLTEAGLPKAVTPHQWGALIGFLAKRKHIVPTGTWRPMKAAGSNGRRSPAYRLAGELVAA